MNATLFLADLLQKGMALWVQDGGLEYWAPKDALTPTVREGLLEHKTELVALVGEGVKYAPLSFAQQRLWLLDQLMPGNPFYNLTIALRLVGVLQVTTLEQTITEIVRRHQALRTTFQSIAGQAAQVIAAPPTVTLPVTDLQTLQDAACQSRVQQLSSEEAQRPFNLAQGPLLRCALLQVSPEEHILLLTMHHIITDGWSLGVFAQELAALYAAFSANRPSPLAELAFQYADFALWQRRQLRPDILEPQLAYWRQQLADISELKLPTDHPRPPIPTYRGATHQAVFPKHLIEALAALAQQEGATLFMVLLAAFKTLLHRYTGQDDIVIGCPTANRSQSEIEKLIGFFVSTQVMRTNLSGSPTFRELVGRVRQTCLGAFAHQDVPFEKLVAELHPNRDLSRNPLFQVVLAIQSPRAASLKMGDLALIPLEFESGTVRFDLEWHMWETPEGMQSAIIYSTDLFEAASIARMAGHFQTLLKGIAANPDQQLAELPLLTQAERQLLVGKPRRRKAKG